MKESFYVGPMIRKDILNSKILSITFFILILSLSFLSLMTHWADSEIWAVTLSKKIFQLEFSSSLVIKFVFHLLLSTVYMFDFNSEQSLDFVRVIFFINAIFILLLTYFISFKVTKDFKKSLFSVLILGTSSFFLSRGFRIRSDLLALTFFLSILSLIVKSTEIQIIRLKHKIFTLLFLMLLSTPKSIYFFLLLIVYLISQFGFQFVFKFIKKSKTILSVLMFLFLVILIYKFKDYVNGLNYYLSSFNENHLTVGYFSWDGFYFVTRFFRENIILLFAFIFLLVFNKRSKFFLKENKSFFYVSLSCALIIIFHNERLPFFVLTFMIVPMMVAGWLIYDCLLLKEKPVLLNFIVLILLSKSIFYTQRFYINNNNYTQKKSMNYIENYLQKNKVILYFDGMGALPRSNRIYHYLSPGSETSEFYMDFFIEEKKPEVILFSNRFFYHKDKIWKNLEENDYMHIGGGVYAKGFQDPEMCKNCYKYTGSTIHNTQAVVAGAAEINTVVRYSPLEPVVFPHNLSFSQIFDFDVRF